MAKHASGTEPGNISIKLLIATPICLILGIFAVGFGVAVLADPGICDFQSMAAGDVCLHGRKLSQRLLHDAGLSAGYGGRPYVLARQQSYNHVAGPLYLLAGLIFVSSSLIIGYKQVQMLRTRRNERK